MAQMSLGMEKYFDSIDLELKRSFEAADRARAKGYDPVKKTDIVLAKNMAERVVGLISVLRPEIKETKIVERIYELEKQYGSQDWRVALTIAFEIGNGQFCAFKSKQEGMEIGIRVGIAYITNGVVASPLEGFTRLEIKKRIDGKEYFSACYSGPIRSAGGTAASVSLLIVDYVRKKMGYETYDITENELKRGFAEILDYHERVTNLQYFPSEEEFLFILKNVPIQVDGDPSERFEVSNYKDLPRVKTNFLRNGPCLVLCEGMCQKASKIWKKVSQWGVDFGLDHWGFLNEFIELQKRIRAKDKAVSTELIKPDYNYIKDLVAGRPVLGYPLRPGGFRLRYGRCRNSGFSSTAVNPTTMILLKNFIGIGCQLKLERPGKATSIATCDKIDGPIVKLKNGNVLYVDSVELAKKVTKDTEEILYLGDILINYGDFLNRAHILVPCGYNEEWYSLEVEKAIKENNLKIIDFGLNETFFTSPLESMIDFDTALEISKRLKVPLHPKFTYYWGAISKEMFSSLVDWLTVASIEKNKIIFPFGLKNNAKRVLELIGVPHLQVGNEYVVIDGDFAKAFAISLGFYSQELDEDSLREACVKKDKALEIVNAVSEVEIRDKCGTFIGARMGRPEKGKMRKLATTPHTLFSVGDEGGRLRCFQSALEKGRITAEFPIYYCIKCNFETIYGRCERCDSETEKRYYCNGCKMAVEKPSCSKHGECKGGRLKTIDIKSLWDKAIRHANFQEPLPTLVKGVRGTSNKDHSVEPILKGILRAKNGIYVNRDGTTRFDMTELVITHFKPKEIGVSIERLKQLGYTKDIYGQEILNKDQVIEMKVQDIILPRCLESKDVGADEILFRVARFIDDLMKYLYKQEPFYNLKTKDDLIGQLVMGLSPHTSAGIVGRILGFSDCQGMVAHPMMHSIMRRDCFAYDTMIPIFDGEKWQNVKIGKFVEKLNPIEAVDAFGTLSKKVDNLYTIGFDKANKKTRLVKINEFTKHQKSPMLNIKLSDGREIKVTENHKFLIKEGNNFKKIRANYLKKGDLFVVPIKNEFIEKDIEFIGLEKIYSLDDWAVIRGISEFVGSLVQNVKKTLISFGLTVRSFQNYLSRDSIPLPLLSLLLVLNKKTFDCLPIGRKIAVKRDAISLLSRIPLNEDMFWLLGFYVAEGYSCKNTSKNGFYQVSFAVSEKELKQKVKGVMVNYFNLLPSYENFRSLTYSSRIFYEFVTKVMGCGCKAYRKRAPSSLFNLPSKKKAAFLRGYLDGDGSVSLSDMRVTCDSVSEGLLSDLEFLFSNFGIFTKRYRYTKKPGSIVRNFYIKKGRAIPEFTITKLIIPLPFCISFYKQINFGLERKKKILETLMKTQKRYSMKINNDENFVYPKVVSMDKVGEEVSYCLNVENHVVLANNLLVFNCDGDEACVMLLMDGLLNFSNAYLPEHRGGRQDEPLVLSTRIIPNEVDDMVFDMDVAFRYPLEFYEAAQNFKFPWDVKIDKVGFFLGNERQYEGYGFTHDTSNINAGNLCSAYKLLPTMEEKVYGQMELAKIIRSVDEDDVARLVLERHFIRDIKGNLRKFSTQQFRCVSCNEKFRRPPLQGRCTKCNGRLLFTVAEGSVVKYLEPSLSLIEKYKLPPYLKQTVELTKMRIEGVFGKSIDKQVGLGKWFG